MIPQGRGTTMNLGYDERVTDDHPERDEVIEKDEIIGMIIDLETMTPDDFFKAYFSRSSAIRKNNGRYPPR